MQRYMKRGMMHCTHKRKEKRRGKYVGEGGVWGGCEGQNS
jgi:hypothetical protein